MTENLLYSLAAIVALLPLGAVAWRREGGRDAVYFMALAAAMLAPLVFVAARHPAAWRTDLSATLWTTVATSMVVFAILAAATREAWRLAPLVAPYLALVALLATLWSHAPDRLLAVGAVASAWVVPHIFATTGAYALATVAAVAALAAILQERALKARNPTALTRILPSIADCEVQVVRLLLAAEAVLAVGLATGMASLYRKKGVLLAFDHKTVLTLAAFVVLAGLLIGHFRAGVRGRQAGRLVLAGYLLLTLGYPGVKFVTEVMLGR